MEYMKIRKASVERDKARKIIKKLLHVVIHSRPKSSQEKDTNTNTSSYIRILSLSNLTLPLNSLCSEY